jgi:2-dehydro-3-deoxyphosphogluconate aldolase/(4S)-4-hydroxy-2-oxoglutarate aldolase
MKPEQLNQMPVVGIIRNMEATDFNAVLKVYAESGLKIVEITMNTPGAEEMIKYANKNFGEELLIGAGTVCSLKDLQVAIDAGARFIVTPVTIEEVIAECVRQDLPIFPGAFTPTEVFKAWTAGATMIKIFPAASAGPQYIKELRGPFAHIPLMPTGGVDQHNVGEFFRAGANAVGVGGKLFDPALIKQKDWQALKTHFTSFASAVNKAR